MVEAVQAGRLRAQELSQVRLGTSSPVHPNETAT